MNEFENYLLESSISMLILYTIYYAFLRNETYFHINRLYLLLSILFSSIMPFLDFTSTVTSSAIVFSYSIDEILVKAQQSTILSPNILLNSILTIYLCGVAFLIFRFVLQIIQITKLVKKHEIKYEKKYRIVLMKKDMPTFSFFNYIFINAKEITNDNFDKIITHEKIHARQLHSFDMIFIEIMSIIYWFNPLVWKYKKSLKETHEYLADAGVVKQGFSTSKYQLLLLHQNVGLYLGLSNNLNKLLTIKRLTMMKKTKSSNISKLKLLFAVPALAMILMVFACTKDNKELMDNNQQPVEKKASVDKTIYKVEQMPEYPGGLIEMKKFIAQNIKYPVEAKANNVQGKVFVRFIVSKTGEVTDAVVVRTDVKTIDGVESSIENNSGNNKSVDISLLENEAVRCISLLPKWKPGKNKGMEVNVYFTVPINFSLQ